MACGLLVFALAAVAGLASGQQTGGTGVYPAKYNLIDPDPSCRQDNVNIQLKIKGRNNFQMYLRGALI